MIAPVIGRTFDLEVILRQVIGPAMFCKRPPGKCDASDLTPPIRNRWFADSPLERSGFELLVPHLIMLRKTGLSKTDQCMT
jgi:hypothetical protein